MPEKTTGPVVDSLTPTTGNAPSEHKSFLEKFWLPIILAVLTPIGTIVVARFAASDKPGPHADAQIIAGLVTDSADQVLGDADIMVVESNDHATSSTSGSFSLKTTAADKTVTLRFSHAGFKPRTELINLPARGLIVKLEAAGATTPAAVVPSAVEPEPVAVPGKKGRISLQYTGDYFACRLQLTFKIAGKSIHPTGNTYSTSVPLGATKYQVSGTIGCPNAGVCAASGSGRLMVTDGARYNVIWRNTSFGKCSVQLLDVP